MKLLERLRRDRPPTDVTAGLAQNDRLLSWATTDAGFVVASRRGLRLPDDRFLAWHRIDKAVWRDGALALTEAVEVDPGVLEAQEPVTIVLTDVRNLPAVVQTRVTQSVAHSSRHTLPSGGAVRVVARRVVGQDGLEWSLRYESGADRTDPQDRAAAEQLLAETRAASTPAE